MNSQLHHTLVPFSFVQRIVRSRVAQWRRGHLQFVVADTQEKRSEDRTKMLLKSNHDTGTRATTFDHIAHVRRVSATLPLVVRREERRRVTRGHAGITWTTGFLRGHRVKSEASHPVHAPCYFRPR